MNLPTQSPPAPVDPLAALQNELAAVTRERDRENALRVEYGRLLEAARASREVPQTVAENAKLRRWWNRASVIIRRLWRERDELRKSRDGLVAQVYRYREAGRRTILLLEAFERKSGFPNCMVDLAGFAVEDVKRVTAERDTYREGWHIEEQARRKAQDERDRLAAELALLRRETRATWRQDR